MSWAVMDTRERRFLGLHAVVVPLYCCALYVLPHEAGLYNSGNVGRIFELVAEYP